MSRDPCVKERRRLLELLRSIMRRAPLSPSQRSRFERAYQVIQSEKGRTASGKRRIFVAVREVAELIGERLADLEGTSTRRMG